MGYDFDALRNPENKLNRTYRSLFNPTMSVRVLQVAGLFLPSWLVRWLPIKRNQDITVASTYIKQICREVITAKQQSLLKHATGPVDIVSVGLESDFFDNTDLVNHMMTFVSLDFGTLCLR